MGPSAEHDTIAAICTPPGRSARSAVRVSGPGAPDAVARLVAPDHDAPPWRRALRRVRVRIGPARELPALLATFDARASYTGEPVAELQLPGNPTLLDRVLGSLVAHEGVRQANPGEFTLRAFLNGRITIEQGEGVAMIIAARNDEELAAGRRLLAGETGSAYTRLADDLAGALALVEAGVDFTDQEDVVAIAPDVLLARLRGLLARIDALLPAVRVGEASEALPVVALVGAPNAGKSTLFNALLGRRRAVVADEPGTTRDALRERIDLPIGAGGAVLVDLAGLDEAVGRRTGADRAAQQAARRVIDEADVLVVCDPAGRFDGVGPLPEGRTALRVRTKADLPSNSSAGGEALAVCALDGWNVEALRRAIADAATGAATGGDLLIAPRHARALSRARESVHAAAGLVEPSSSARHVASPELVAQAMREALDALGEIAGRVPPDDVIGRIFAGFCVGK